MRIHFIRHNMCCMHNAIRSPPLAIVHILSFIIKNRGLLYGQSPVSYGIFYLAAFFASIARFTTGATKP